MLLNLDHMEDGAELDCDVCIVGAGAAGFSLARALADAGRDICLIEAGGAQLDPRHQDRLTGESVGAPGAPHDGRYCLLGGSTAFWSGRCAPLDRIDFEPRDWVPLSGWPLAAADLERHYEAAEIACGFDRPWSLARGEEIGFSAATPRTEAVHPYLWRYAPTGWKRYQNWSDRFLPDLRRATGVRVLINASLDDILFEDGRPEVKSIIVRSLRGRWARIGVKRMVLCCGGIENPRLLLNAAERAPEAFGPVRDSIGRFFMQHPRAETAIVQCSPDQGARLQNTFNNFTVGRGVQYEAGFALSAGTQREGALLNASAHLRFDPGPGSARLIWDDLVSGRLPGVQGWRTIARTASRLDRVAERGWRRMRGRHAVHRDPHVRLIVDVEQAPDRESRITLMPARDQLGLRKVRIDWRIADIERRTSAAITGHVAALLNRFDLGRLTPGPDLDKSGGFTGERMSDSYHHIGATRMSSDPKTGVVDPTCRVHGISNLYVCGGSAMPTGGHANPTFTIVALALRLAEHLIQSAVS